MQYPLPNLNNSTQAFHTTQATQVFHTTQYVTHATECISQLALYYYRIGVHLQLVTSKKSIFFIFTI